MTSRDIPAARVVFSAEDRRQVLAMIDESLLNGSLTLGPRTRAFEEEFGLRHRARFAVAVSSGTAALEIILRHLGIEGREVIVPTNTFYATAGAVVHAGGHLKLADVDPVTLALSPATIEAALSPRTAAVVLVHIGGVITPAADAIRTLCDAHGVTLVEDAAHAHGSTFDGRHAGSFGYAAAFSFYPTKVVTSGEGGMILTADEALRDDAIVYRDQGKAGFFGGEHVRMGHAWRMSELHAATGLVHQRRLEEFVGARRRMAAVLDEELSGLDGIEPQAIPAASKSNYYKYVAMLGPGIDRDTFKQRLREQHGVSPTGEVYAQPLHRHPVFAHLDAGGFPVAEEVCARQVCLPLHSDMTIEEARYVAASVREVISTMQPESVAPTARTAFE
jgi:dTDP-4-amino-4,6-dideoxygalactose transaminase